MNKQTNKTTSKITNSITTMNNTKNEIKNENKLNINLPNITPCIYASQLSSIMDNNNYQNIVDTILDIWKRCYKINYNRTIKYIESLTKSKYRSYNDKISLLISIAKNNGIDIEKDLDDCLSAKDIKLLQKKQKHLLNKVKHILKNDVFTIFRYQLNNITNSNFGIKEEQSAIKAYEKYVKKCSNKDIKVLCDNRFIKTVIYKDTTNNNLWYIGGKIDGILQDGTLIEIKNRIYKHFNRVRSYENTQIQAYLHILNLKHANLIEALKIGDEYSINVLPVIRDHKLWNNLIMPRIKIFIRFFNLFLVDDNIKLFFLIGDKEQAKSVVQCFFDNQ